MSKELRFSEIGNYKLITLVGSGGLGEVYKAQHKSTGKIVALKRLHDQYQENQKLLGLFHKEIMIQARISHRHCVKFIEADLIPGAAYIVSSYIDGYNCYNLIREKGKIPPIVAVSIVFDLLRGLEHLHCLDIVHSDLTPSNVMLNKKGLTILTDFGLSCISEVEDYAGVKVGTPGYQSPERFLREPVTKQADIYCVGIILYEMLKGSRLFFGQKREDIIKTFKNIDTSWLNTGSSELDKHLSQILITSLKYEHNKRYRTVREFMFELYNCCLKVYNISHTRRAILQWMRNERLTHEEAVPPIQRIWVTPPTPKSITHVK